MILDEIVEKKRIQLKSEMQQISINEWKQRLKRPGLHKPIDFFGALKKDGEMSIIGEVKKASPSKGIIREDFDPVELALEYCRSNVQAVSVLTEKNFFR